MKRLIAVGVLMLAAMLMIPALVSAQPNVHWNYDIRISNSQSQTTDASQGQSYIGAFGPIVQQQVMAGGNAQFSAALIGTAGAVLGGSGTAHGSLNADLPGHPNSPHVNAFTTGLAQAAVLGDVKVQGQRYAAEQGQYASGPALFTGSQSQSESQSQNQSATGRRTGSGCIGFGC